MLWAHSQSLKSVEASRPCFEVLMFLGFKWDSVRLRLVGWNLGEIKDLCWLHDIRIQVEIEDGRTSEWWMHFSLCGGCFFRKW